MFSLLRILLLLPKIPSFKFSSIHITETSVIMQTLGFLSPFEVLQLIFSLPFFPVCIQENRFLNEEQSSVFLSYF